MQVPKKKIVFYFLFFILIFISPPTKAIKFDFGDNKVTGEVKNLAVEDNIAKTNPVKLVSKENKLKETVHVSSLQLSKPNLTSQQRFLFQQVMATVSNFKVRFNTRHNVPVYMKGNPLYSPCPKSHTVSAIQEKPEKVSLDAVNHYKKLFKLENPYTELVPKKTVRNNKIHVKLAQYYRGIPVWGKELTVHLDTKSQVYLIEGHILPTPTNISTKPIVSKNVAISKAASDLDVVYNVPPSAQLVIMEDDAGILHLAWKIEINKGWKKWRYFIDASNGLIIKKYSLVMDVSVNASGTDLLGITRNFHVWQEGGTYYMADSSLPISLIPPDIAARSVGQGNVLIFDAHNAEPEERNFSASLISSSTPSSWDSSAVSALYNIETTLLYYYNTFGRKSIDNANMNVLGIVHVGSGMANAFWSSSSNAMFFGDGDGTTFDNLSKALDVVAHELTHGVTSYTANLEYQFQSGALNEAFSDIFGVMVDRDDWMIGEDIVLVSPYNLRNLEDPHDSLQQPAPSHMDEYQELPIDQDNGGVHINATIPAHAAYLIASSIGRDKAENIFYKALTEHLTATSDFWDFCSAISESAEELYGTNSAEVQACNSACVQVGILESSAPPGGGGGGEIPPQSGGDYVLFFFYEWNQNYNDYVLMLGEIFPDGKSYYLSKTPALSVRPAPYYQDSNYIFFVDASYTLRMANATSSYYEEYIVEVAQGEIWSIATSPASNYLALTSKYESDNRIYLWEIGSSSLQYVEIQFTPPDASSTISSYYPDVITFSLDGKYVFFDCINKMSVHIGGGTVTYQFWNIGAVDIKKGQTFMLFAPPPEGIQVGNPAAAQTKSYLLAYDIVSFNKGLSETRIVNLKTGRSGQVWYGTVAGESITGFPYFNGDDSYIYLQDAYYSSITRVPLANNGDVWYGNTNSAQSVIDSAYLPCVYRPGERSVSPRAEVSTTDINFGSVPSGYSKEAEITLSNRGNYPLVLQGIHLSDTSNFDVNAVHTTIPPNQSYLIKVMFKPSRDGSYNATLTIYTSDPQNEEIAVALHGIAGGNTSNYANRVQEIYIAYYGRPADPAGLDYWTSRLVDAGGNLYDIMQEFGRSSEFIRRYGGLTNEQLIDTIYHQMFNRGPDSAGKAFYLSKLESGEMTLQTITLNILDGATGIDERVIENKLEVANYFTQKVRNGCPYTSEDIGVRFLEMVDDDPQSVSNAKRAIDQYCGS